MNNRVGNIPVTLLVIGVFAVCTLALISFFISDFEVTNSFIGVSVLQNVNSLIDEYYFYKKAGMSSSKLNNYFDLDEKNGRKYIYFEKKTDKLIFSVRYPVS